jgi:undecaprenyl-diphosphatase
MLHLAQHGGAGARSLAAAASEASRGGGLWAGLTVAAALSPRTRAAGRDGLAGWAAASAAAFALKHLVQRPRPRPVTRLGSSPRTSSMPSSHTAGAVAYATAATLRAPIVGPLVVPVAATVAWSRAATGRHFPTDIAAGATLGLVAGLAVHHALPPRRSGAPTPGSRSPAASPR